MGLGVNTNAYFPRPYLSNERNKNYQAQSRYLQNGAYLRLKNLQFGYSLPKNITEKIKMEKVRFFFTGENLFTITGRFPKGMDPETAKKLDDSKARGDSKSHFAQSVFVVWYRFTILKRIKMKNNYISKYYGEQLTYRGENYSIPEFITRLSEETADVLYMKCIKRNCGLINIYMVYMM